MQRTTSNHCSGSRRVKATGSGSPVMSLLVVLLVLPPSSSSTLSIMPVLGLPMTLSRPSLAVPVNSMAWSTSIGRPSHPMVSPVFTVVSFLPLLVSSSTAVSISVSTTRSSLSSLSALLRVRSWLPSVLVGVLPLVLALLPILLIPSGTLLIFVCYPSTDLVV